MIDLDLSTKAALVLAYREASSAAPYNGDYTIAAHYEQVIFKNISDRVLQDIANRRF